MTNDTRRCVGKHLVLVASALLAISPAISAASFVRGDTNADGEVDGADAVGTLSVLFGGRGEIACDDAADANDDGSVDISDAIRTLTYLYVGGVIIPSPGPSACGSDPTADAISCGQYVLCDDGALQVFLDPDGDDARDGLTLETAVVSLERAHEIISSESPDQDFEVLIAPGRYFGQCVDWTYTLPDHAITFRRLDSDGERPVFDGSSASEDCERLSHQWFRLRHSTGSPTNLNFEYIRVENYRTAISLEGSRYATDGSNSHNRIYGCYFDTIGNVFRPELKRSTAAVRLKNSDENLIRNNHFVDVINARDEEQRALHAIYAAHMSEGNEITHNRFWNVGGDPVKFRDASSHNVVTDNVFHKTGHSAAVLDAYCRNDESLFNEPAQWSEANTLGGLGWYVGDFDGDGKDDLLSYINGSGGAYVYLARKDDDLWYFEFAGKWSGYGTRGGRGWYVGDFNGDGKDDILRYTNASGGADVLLSTGTTFDDAGTWTGFGVRGGEGWYVGDFNGDGRDDILRYLNEHGGADVFLSTGEAFDYAGTWSGFGVRGGEGWYVGDFNGDGKDDILRYTNENGGADVLLSTGTRFDDAGTWSGYGTRGGRGWYIGDFDGDGRDDLLRYHDSHVGGADVLLNYGQFFGQAVDWTAGWRKNDPALPGGEGWYVGDFRGQNRSAVVRYADANGGAEVVVQVCTKTLPECPSWNNEVRDNSLDGTYRDCAVLLPFDVPQTQAPPPGCPAPNPSWERIFPGLNQGNNTDSDGIPCSEK